MQEKEEFFEMAPPTMFSVAGGKFLASGKASRHEDVTPEIQAMIRTYCRSALEQAEYPVERFYPDLARSPQGVRREQALEPT
jgi:hypothetical protein